ncbi:hypothetical protein DPMN_147456 [Dreissena polymorpha]|uniref:Uncharacterized protein n=1 Tax=Dreissena polymorpha TaxID=45954 RepID=A0A9D4F7X1_DREPO|nr:hypothetical protein DPMN_147456 [Dreissena polymorpha]
MWAVRSRIDRIAIREVQYQLEVNRCRNEENIVKGNFGWVWPMWAGRPRLDSIVIREVQQFFGGCGLCGWDAPGLVMGPCIVEIGRILIREVQYQFEVHRFRNEEIIVKGNFGWVWSMWDGRPRIDHIILREVQYQFEVNRLRNKDVNFQGSSANSVGGDSGKDGRTAEITITSPRFSKSVVLKNVKKLY